MLPSRTLRGFALTLLLGVAAAAEAHESSTNVQELQDSLVTFSTSDFEAHSPRPNGFRNVDIRYRENDNGARSYMLCGQFRLGVGPKAGWADFATIKTDPYEQWTGATAADMCARAIPVSPGGKDLSLALQTALGDNAPPTIRP